MQTEKTSDKPTRRRATSTSSRRDGRYVRERDGRFTGHVKLAKKPGEVRAKYLAETFGTEAEAEAWCLDMQARLRLGLKVEAARPAMIPLKRAGDLFIERLKQIDSAADHIANTQRVLDQAVAFGLGDMLGDGFVSEARRFIAGLKRQDKQPASQSTKNCYITTLRSIGNFAVKERKIDGIEIAQNPFDRVEKITVAEPLKGVFDLDEVRKLVDQKHSDHPFHRLFCAMIYTGMRIGEATRMNWSWFAWKDDVIAIQSSRKARANLGTTDLRTKTSRGRLTRLMHEFADIMRADLKPGEEPPKTGPVFPEYAAMDNKSKSRRFDAYLTHCGVPVEDNGHSRTPHSCRHTWTCLMLASGENEMLVKQYAGHSEKEMTEHYAEQQERFRKRVRAEEWEPGELRLQPPSDGVDEPSPAETSNVIAGPWRRSTAN